MNNNVRECKFLWFIENYSYCWQNIGEKLVSPVFTADRLEGTIWNLELYPRGATDEEGGNISFCMYRNDDDGPWLFPVQFRLSIFADDGTCLKKMSLNRNYRKETRSERIHLKMDEVLSHRKNEYLPKDILTLHCVLYRHPYTDKVSPICARTRIGIEHISFHHVVQSFSAFGTHRKETFQIRCCSKKGHIIACRVSVNDSSWNEEKLMVEITPYSNNQVLATCEIVLLGASGKKIKCAEADNRYDYVRKNIGKLTLSITKDAILKDAVEYLRDDKLYLIFDCTFSTGIEYQNIEGSLCESTTSPEILVGIDPRIKDIYTDKLSSCRSAMDDLKDIYNNEFLTDVVLKTKTNSFPAHKIVLCARSPVFKVMLSNDMKEKNSDSIQVDDLGDDTVEQMLLFLYSDALEDLQWETATKLYYAADKYQIEKLRLICSSFLVENVTTSSAVELLLLADTHSDSVLKNVAEDFILQHDELVFSSEKWRDLMEANPQLALKTMHLKYMDKEVGK